MVKTLGIDLGNSNLAAYNGCEKFTCPSTYAEGVDKLELGYQVLYNGKKILIGDKTIDYDYYTDKERDCKRIMMYMILHQLCANHDHVVIVANIPIDDYLNKKKRISFKKFLEEKKEVMITVGITTKTIYIDEVLVVAEGMGVAYRYPQLFADKLTPVIDIGGGEVNNALFEDFNLVRGQSFSEPMGMKIFYKNLKGILSKKGTKLNDIALKYLVRDPGEQEAFISNYKNEYVEQLDSNIKGYRWSDTSNPFFTGGGVLILQDEIKQKFPNSTISTDPLYDNCVGNYLIGVLLCEKKQM